MKNIFSIISSVTILIVSIIIVLISNYQGAVNPPASITFTPFLIPIITLLNLSLLRMNFFCKFGIITGLIILNDILIRIYAGGTHDSAGNGWIVGMLLIGVIISFVIILLYYFIKEDRKKIRKSYWISFSTYFIVLILYLNMFGTFGMTYGMLATESVNESKEKGVFISSIKFSTSYFTVDNDTIKVKSGWVEKEIQNNHTKIIPKIENTGRYEYIILLSNLPKKYREYEVEDSHICYDTKNSNYLHHISKHPISLFSLNYLERRANYRIEFVADNLEDTIFINFYLIKFLHQEDRKLLKRIHLMIEKEH